MNAPVARALVLVGPMGAGKTSVGRRLAKTLGVSFTDTDKLIVRDHGPIADLFVGYGEAHFRALERDAVREALAQGGVIALGGGAVLNSDTRADLVDHDVILLTVSPRIVAGRINGEERPLLAGEDPVARWRRILGERMPVYREVADVTFDTSSGPLAGVVSAIVEWKRARDESTPFEEDA